MCLTNVSMAVGAATGGKNSGRHTYTFVAFFVLRELLKGKKPFLINELHESIDVVSAKKQ